MICRISSGFLVASAGLVLPGMLPPARSVLPVCLGPQVRSAILVAKPRPGMRHAFVVLLADASMLPLASVLPCSVVPTVFHVLVTALIVIVGPPPNAGGVGYVAGLLCLLLTCPEL